MMSGAKRLMYLNMSFLGIQFVFSLSSSHISRVLQYYHVTVEQLPMFWLLAPLSGLILQPIMGQWADKTWTRWGRRKPFIFAGAVLTACVLWAIPNASLFLGWLSPNFVLGLMILLLYAAINITMDPSRAMIGDVIRNEDLSKGFAIQTFITGIGAIIGAAFPYLFQLVFLENQLNKSIDTLLQVRWAFYFGVFLILSSVGWTLFHVKESPFEGTLPKNDFWKSLLEKLFTMPKVMKKLAWVQFFSWFAFFNLWVFATPAIAAHFFKVSDVKVSGYSNAADWVGVLFAVYSAVSAIYALVIPKIANALGKVFTHALSLAVGAIGFIVIYWIHDEKLLLFSMIAIGIAWGSILSMPYAILVQYLPKQHLGAYMGIFNIFITLPQLVSGLFSGWILSTIFHHETVNILYLSGFSLLISSILILIMFRKSS